MAYLSISPRVAVALGLRGTFFCTCFNSGSPQEAFTRDEKVRRSFLCTSSVEGWGRGVGYHTTQRRKGLVWKIVGFSLWQKMVFTAVVFLVTVQCSQNPLCRLHLRIHSAPLICVSFYANTTVWVTIVGLWSSDLENRN